MFTRITFDPKIMGGRACIRGMRITASLIVDQIAHGATVDEILKEYPDLEREDVQERSNMRRGSCAKRSTPPETGY